MRNEKRLVLDWTKAHDVCPLEKKLADEHSELCRARDELIHRYGPSPEYTGWIDFVAQDQKDLILEIEEHVENVSQHSDAIVIIGIGGSFLGPKAISQALTHSFSAYRKSNISSHPTLFWAGNHLATDEMAELLDILNDYTPSLVVVSKSGSTMEPALAFRILKQYLNERFGEKEANARVTVVTDSTSGHLSLLAKEQGYPTFTIPADVGGRYSVFTVVGLLPLAFAGISVHEFLAGAQSAREDAISEKNNSLETNPALCYAGLRNILYKEGYKIESLCVWSPKLKTLGEWWTQLFAESDAKEGAGIFPVSTEFSRDLHSLGQYFQDGERHLFATHLKVSDEYSILNGSLKRKVQVPASNLNDNFDYLSHKNLSFVQSEAQLGTILAHSDGQVPTLVWEIPELNAWWLGYWMYTNMFACAVGDYARGVDPFNQPGVENYKKNMLALLGQPGMQQNAAQIKSRLAVTKRLCSLGMTCGV